MKASLINNNTPKGSTGYIEPGQDDYIYRCKECSLRGFSTMNFGKWRPLYYTGSRYKSSAFKAHFEICKGMENSVQRVLPPMIDKIGTKRQRTQSEAKIQCEEESKQGMLMSFGLVEVIAKQEISMTKRIPLLSWGDKLLAHGYLTKHWRGKNYTQTMLPFICHVLKDHDFDSLRNGTFWSVILDESTDITFNKNLCLLSKTRSERKFIGIVSINDGRRVTIANATKELFEKYCIPLANCCGIGSDGASCMTGQVNGFVKFWQDMVRDVRGDKGAQDSVIQVYCISHRVALAITDLHSLKGDEGKLLAIVDQLCRVAYSFYARSTVNRKEYMKLQSTFLKLKLPNSLCETRWIGRYRCIATLDDYGKAMQQFIHDNFRHRSTTEGAFIREFYFDHVSDLHDLRRILHIVWRLSQRNTTREFIALAGICLRTQRTGSHLRAI